MNWQFFTILVFLAILSLALSCLNFRYSTRTIFAAFAIVLFSLCSSFVWNVETLVVKSDDSMIYQPVFREWEMDAIAWFMYVMAVISLILFLINMFLTFQDYRHGKQNGRINRKWDGNRDGLYD